MASTKKLQDDELLELGKKLQQFYDMGYVNKKQTILFSFYKGLAGGLGAFLGGTIIVGLLLWILSLFNNVQFVNHIVNNLHHTLQSK